MHPWSFAISCPYPLSAGLGGGGQQRRWKDEPRDGGPLGTPPTPTQPLPSLYPPQVPLPPSLYLLL